VDWQERQPLEQRKRIAELQVQTVGEMPWNCDRMSCLLAGCCGAIKPVQLALKPLRAKKLNHHPSTLHARR
jgi:hypothetical protein